MTAVKKCSRCEKCLPIIEFRRMLRGDPCSYCIPCEKDYKREWYERNRRRIIDKTAAWRSANPERYIASNKAYYAATKDDPRRRASWQQRNSKPETNTYKNAWRDANIEKQRAAEARYRERNRRACSARIADWKKRNPDRLRHYFWTRRAAFLKALPAWADLDAIAAVYERSAAMQGTHVDHIVPLISKLVCGLHCEANLRVVDGVENMRKNNRWWPDMP